MKNSVLVSLLLAGATIVWNPGVFGQIAWTIDPEKPVFTGRVHKFPQTENTNLLNLSRPTGPHLLSSVRRVPLQYPTIQIAIDASSNGDTVLVSDGTYYENIHFRGKKIVVASTYLTTGDTSHISQTVIDGGGAIIGDSASVVYFVSGEDTNSVLCGFKITGGKGTNLPGWASREGGGVLCIFSGARLIRNIITGNSLSGGNVYGGGVSADGGTTLIMEGNVIEGNTLNGTWAVGGGVQIYQINAVVNDNRITDNTASTQGPGSASHGGGISCEAGTYQLNNNLIARNRALAPAATSNCYGGGIIVRAANLEFRNNRVVDNLIQTSTGVIAYGGGISVVAVDLSEHRDMMLSGNYIGGNSALGGSLTIGGGIGISNENPRMENNIIENNSAVNGGGVGIEGSVAPVPAVLVNNTICDNNATAGGGALLRAGARVAAFNNIFWADTAQSHAEISVLSSTADVLNCDVQGGYAGTGNIDLDPQFAVSDSLFNLTSTSPCIGRALDSLSIGGIWYYAPTSDYDGHSRHRPVGLQPSDIGAQEEQVTQVIPNVRDGQPDMPVRFSLDQNYPNPFNPKTGIRYQVSGVSDVKLVVFDLLGREVAVLVNKKQPAGVYEVSFDGSALASGVYIYRLTAGSFVKARQMVLVK